MPDPFDGRDYWLGYEREHRFRGFPGILQLKEACHFLGLLRGVTNDHGSGGEVVFHDTGALKVVNDVVEHGFDELRVGVNKGPVFRVLEHLDLLEGLLELEPVFGLYFLADEAERVAVCDGSVVIVFVDVVAKDELRVVGLPSRGAAIFAPGALECAVEQGSSREPNLDGIAVGLVEIRQEAALRIVAAVHFIQKINALEIQGVVAVFYNIRGVRKTVDIHDGDLRESGMIVNGEVGFDVFCELFA